MRRARILQHMIVPGVMAEMYEEQLAEGHYFLHEHPSRATSWQMDVMQNLIDHPEVLWGHADQCQYGAEAERGSAKGLPILKPT